MDKVVLPEEWCFSDLSALISCDGLISDGDWIESKDQDQNGEVRLIQLADIGDGYFRDKSARFMTPDKAALLNCTYLERGDVLIARMPDPLGRACVFPGVSQKAVTVVDVCIIRTNMNSALLGRLLVYWINSLYIRGEMIDNASGTTRKRITRKKIEKMHFPVPPLAEQKVIADKLDTLLAQVENTKARLTRIRDILKQFRQSVLAAAVSGKLTEDWQRKNPTDDIKCFLQKIQDERTELKLKKYLKKSFGQVKEIVPLFEGIPKNWEWSYFEQFSENENNALKAGPFGSALKKSDCTAQGYKVYGQEQVISGNESLDTYFIDEEKYKSLESCKVQSGDILISLVGTVGKVLILSPASEAGIINPRLVKLSLNKQISREYIKIYLDSFIAHNFFKSFSHGGTMEIINLSILKQLPVPLPPLEEQTEIVRRVEALFAHADRIEAQVQAAMERVEKLTPSILAKAFRGELTADWRAAHPDLISGENSAAALLAKIEAERKASKTTRGKRK